MLNLWRLSIVHGCIRRKNCRTFHICMTKLSHFPYSSTYSSTPHNTNRKHNNILQYSKSKNTPSTTVAKQQKFPHTPHSHYNIRFQRSRHTRGGTVSRQTTPVNRDHLYPNSLLFVSAGSLLRVSSNWSSSRPQSCYDDDWTKPNSCSSRWRETYIRKQALLPGTLVLYVPTTSLVYE